MSKIETDHLPITALIGAHTANDNGAEFCIVDITIDRDGEIWLYLSEFDDLDASVGVKWSDWIPRFGASLQPINRVKN